MQTRNVATVFGGSGFLGRYVVKRLAAAGFVVRVAVRDTEAAAFLKTMGSVGQIVPLAASITSDENVARAVEGAAIVVNTVGILAESRPGDFQALQADGAGRIARAAAAAGVARLIHVSAIGADAASESLYARSKAAGEAQMLAAFPGTTILRPSLVFGQEDQFFNRFGQMASLSPIMPVICGDTRFQPVYVGDVADAVMACLADPATAGKIYELAGPKISTFREILAWILQITRRHRMLLDVPLPLARLQARLLEHLPGKLLTQDQLILLAKDNVAGDLPGLQALGIVPTPVEQVVPLYLKRFRPGGGKREALEG
jgi:NADH dehydrogenase